MGRLLRPSSWSLAVLVLFWGWRVAALSQRAAYGFDWNAAALAGFAWDGLLVAGLFALVRRRAFEARGVFGDLAALALGAVLVGFVCVVRGVDLAHCTLGAGHWDSSGFLYLRWSNAPLLASGDGRRLLALGGGVWLACVGALALDLRATRRRLRTGPRPPRAGLRASLAGVALLAIPLAAGWDAREEAMQRFVPESNFAYQWLVWRGWAGREQTVLLPEPAVLARLEQVGLAPRPIVDERYPLWRASIDPTPFPYPPVERADAGRPNVVVTLVEALNHDFVHAFSGELKGVMPELSRLTRQMTRVTDYRSTTNPTIHALVAVFCSVLHPSTAPQERMLEDEHFGAPDSARGPLTLVHTPLSCLPEILRQNGYRTVFVQGGAKDFSNKGAFLRAHGFEEVHGLAEVSARFRDRRRSPWGVHDQMLVRYVREQIRRLEELRAQDGRPYFLAMLTLDTHSPGQLPPACWPTQARKYATDERSDRMLRSLFCADRELGKLGRFLLNDEARRDSTVWLLTGDHPAPPMGFVKALYRERGEPFPGWHGRLPLLIHDPTHRLPEQVPVLSGHVDLAPTLLHIVGLADVPGAMTGYSIFGERPAHPLLVGRVGSKYVALYTPTADGDLTMGALRKACAEEVPVLPADPGAPRACDLLTWVRWQNTLWSYRRIAPPAPS